MNIGVVFVRYEEAGAFGVLHRSFLSRVDFVEHVVHVDNKREINNHVVANFHWINHYIAGSNRAQEFSGYSEGLHYLRLKGFELDGVLFVNDSIVRDEKRILEKLKPRHFWKAIKQQKAFGVIYHKPVLQLIRGEFFPEHLQSHVFFIPWKLLPKTLVPIDEEAMNFYLTPDGLLNNLVHAPTRAWLNRYVTRIRKAKDPAKKLHSIFNENLLLTLVNYNYFPIYPNLKEFIKYWLMEWPVTRAWTAKRICKKLDKLYGEV